MVRLTVLLWARGTPLSATSVLMPWANFLRDGARAWQTGREGGRCRALRHLEGKVRSLFPSLLRFRALLLAWCGLRLHFPACSLGTLRTPDSPGASGDFSGCPPLLSVPCPGLTNIHPCIFCFPLLLLQNLPPAPSFFLAVFSISLSL